MKRIPLTCYCILLRASFAQAELTVVGDSPEDVTRPYFHVTGAQRSDRVQTDRAMHADLSTFTDEAWILPVRSSHLSRGPITPRTLNMPGLQPFFLVGGDPQSLTWLRQRAAELREMGAAGRPLKSPIPKPCPNSSSRAGTHHPPGERQRDRHPPAD
jgi:hypothetical protein